LGIQTNTGEYTWCRPCHCINKISKDNKDAHSQEEKTKKSEVGNKDPIVVMKHSQKTSL
jgi:hypothetical protein